MPPLLQLSLPSVAGTIVMGILISSWAILPPTHPAVAVNNTDIPTCSQLRSVNKSGKDYLFTATASGGTNSITGYTFDFGDHQTYRVTFSGSGGAQDRARTAVPHGYYSDGVYTVTAAVLSKAGGKTATSSSPGCTASIIIGTSVTTLPLTGDTYAPVVFLVTALAGALAYRLWIQHRITDRRK